MSNAAVPLPEALSELSGALSGDLALMVARDAAGEEAYRLDLAATVAAGLRDLGRGWVQGLEDKEAVPYEATAELAEGQVFLIEDEATLADLHDMYAVAAGAPDLATIPADELDQRIGLYAVVVGQQDHRIALLKRSDPRIGYRGKRTFLAVLEGRLERLESPTFAFYTSFDVVLAPTWALVVNQAAFERLFRDAGLVEQHIDEWVEGIGAHLPWAPNAVEALREVALRDSRIWRRLREINSRGHLAQVSITDVSDYAGKMDMDVDALIVDEQLVFNPEDRFTVLHLLNEDLFRGPLTEEKFEAQRKATA